MRKIKLDLQPGQDGGLHEADGFIQLDARERLMKFLTDVPADPTSTGDQLTNLSIIPDRRHRAIFINARRGEGKTTLLTKVLQEVASDKNLAGLVKSLGIIDPTLIESKQNIVIVVLDRLKEAVDQVRRQTPLSNRQAFDSFDQSLQRLARGLSMLDGIGGDRFYGGQWEDPEFILSQGLEDAHAGTVFELHFHELVRNARSALSVKSFVLAIDDVDTRFSQGSLVLEAVRKYLTSPYLKIIISGDLDLFSLLVRGEQWRQMGDPLLAAERWAASQGTTNARMIAVTEKVDELQNQYLVKILPPENRIDLRPLIAIKDRLTVQIEPDQAAGVPIGRFTRPYCERLVSLRAREDQRAVEDLLLRIPTRSGMQLMITGADLVRAPVGTEDEPRRRALEALRHVAWADLLRLGLAPERTRSVEPRDLHLVLASWFTKARLWRDMPRFHVETGDEGRDLPALFGAALCNDVFRRAPSHMIDYWIKLSIMRELVDSGRVVQSAEDAVPGTARDEMWTTEKVVRHANLLSEEESIQTVGRFAAWESVRGKRVEPGMYLTAASVPLDRIRETQAATLDLYGLDYAKGKTGDRAAGANLPRGQFKGTTSSRDQLVDALPAPLRSFHTRLGEAGWDYRSRRGKEPGFLGSFANSVFGLQNRLGNEDAKRVLALPALEIVSGQQKGQGGYSFIRLLGVVSLLAQAAYETGYDNLDDLQRRVEGVLDHAALTRSYPTPGGDYDQEAEPDVAGRSRRPKADTREAERELEVEDEDADVIANAQTEGRSDDSPPLAEALARWLHHWTPSALVVPPLVLSRIWARFTYAHTSVRANLRPLESRYLGTLMHRTTLVFLHAVGVEVARAADRPLPRLAILNPVGSLEPFLAFLSEMAGGAGGEPPDAGAAGWGAPELALFEFLFTCPLWAFFLSRTTEIEPARFKDANERVFAVYRERIIESGLIDPVDYSSVPYTPMVSSGTIVEFDGLYDLLNTIQLQGSKSPAVNAHLRSIRSEDPQAEEAGA